jgi:antitoxin component of MazEF toxin-antitoxin module
MSNTKTIYTGTVVEDGDDLALVFPPEMLEELGWIEGDTIVWDIDENNRVLIARKKKPGDDE